MLPSEKPFVASFPISSAIIKRIFGEFEVVGLDVVSSFLHELKLKSKDKERTRNDKIALIFIRISSFTELRKLVMLLRPKKMALV